MHTRSSIANGMAMVLCVMLILFPKGGLRLGALPLTWGYLLLFASLLLCFPYRLLGVRSFVLPTQGVVLLCLLPFAILLGYTVLAFGAPDLGGLVSSATGLIFLPLLFIWFYPPLLTLVDGEFLLKCMRVCILSAAIFGIFLFVWRPLTGSWIQIPYLTVNADDVGDFANTKNIARGFFFKLISTYNNGNIYGAATLILLSLYEKVTPKRWQRWTVWVALFLTLSRTVWAGMVFYLLLSVAAALFAQRRDFPVVRLGGVVWVAGALLLVTPLFFFASSLFSAGGSAFLLDPTLGGRTGQFTSLGSRSVFPMEANSLFFTEVTYLSAINLFGYVGLPVITLVLASPLLVLLADRSAIRSPIRRAALKGLILYGLVSLSDGALNYIPVMAFYWFAYMIFLFDLPTLSAAHSLSAPGADEASRLRSSLAL